MVLSEHYFDPGFEPGSPSAASCRPRNDTTRPPRWYEYMDSNGLFNENKFDFRHRRTVDDQLLLTYGIVSKWYNVVDNMVCILCILLCAVMHTIYKAFYVV